VVLPLLLGVAGTPQPSWSATAAGNAVSTANPAPQVYSLALPRRTGRLTSSPAGGQPTPPPAGSLPPVDCRKAKCVALTFDDGPVRQTAHVLDVLRSRGARATFFVLGVQASKRAGLLRRMVADGDAVGNHSWNHPKFAKLSAKAIRNQLARTERVITAAIGAHQRLVRTPFGQQDARIRKLVAKAGAPVILWNVDPEDWKYRNTKTVVHKVVKAVRRNSIVLIHDIRPTTRAGVAQLVERLQAKGYVLVTVPELLGGSIKPGKVYLHG
jgi:peptidoglycan/xylan/chitin deacetylase (PgdA/CDA1 family)